MQKTYVAAVYPRFNGLYYTVRFLDFDDKRGQDLEPDNMFNVELITKDLQSIVNEMVKEGKTIPEPNEEKYASFSSSYGDDVVRYVKVLVNVPC